MFSKPDLVLNRKSYRFTVHWSDLLKLKIITKYLKYIIKNQIIFIILFIHLYICINGLNLSKKIYTIFKYENIFKMVN